MWTRNEAKPTIYKGIQFRSALEAKVAEQLDALTVEWKYEVPAHQAMAWLLGPHQNDPPQVPYLPDFLIIDAPDYLQLPTWVEVKPSELLYAVRDHVDCPERFDDIRRSGITGQEMYSANLDEIWKPKRAAEIYQHDVLVVSEINRTRTLSILLTSTHVELSKCHPAVNHRELVRKQEQERLAAERQAEWERREAERRDERRQWARKAVAHARVFGRSAKYPGTCHICSRGKFADDLVIFKSADDRWVAICRAHVDAT